MTLPFAPKGPRKREYTCFVCGKDYALWDEFSQHIKSEHVQGREWIECPIEHCKAPVRCLRTHFRAKHPGIEIPRNCQLKSTIWYDFSGSKRRRTKKPDFKEGYFVSEKNNFAKQHYRSGLELRLYECLENNPQIYKWEVEPNDCVVDYYFDGNMKKYHPDVKVVYLDGVVEVIEVKPKNQEHLPINEAKWDQAAKTLGNRNWNFRVVNEKMIERMEAKSRKKKP